MQYRGLLFLQFFVLFVIALLYFVGLVLFLQWIFWWYDILLHFLGGVWVALATGTALLYLGYRPRLVHIIAAIAAVGILWEVFEVVIGAYREANYPLDTAIDLVMDTIGSLAGLGIVRYLEKNGERPVA